MGSIVYVAEILKGADYIPAVMNFLENTLEIKKYVGIVLTKDSPYTETLKALKTVGAKKIAFIKKEPSIGDWKRSHMIFTNAYFDTGRVSLRIVQYFDQDALAKLEGTLPHIDMHRGQIGLKLAKTLINLTQYTDIIDPFCGLGRNIIAGLGVITSAELSDMDPKAMIQSRANVEYALNKLKITVPLTYAEQDASLILPANPANQAVVTEGWLGDNHMHYSTNAVALGNTQKVFSVYKKSIERWSQLGVAEVVLCMPFYPNLPKLTPDIEEQFNKIISGTNYTITTPGNHQFIRYARPDTFVGHLIVRLTYSK
jgi:tRNA G10  N-methylase Trm11